MRDRLTKDESGQVIVIVALLMTALLGAAALSIDVGAGHGAKHRLQGVAEAAALAAARDLPDATLPSPGTPGTCNPLPASQTGKDVCNLVTTNLAGSDLASSATVKWSKFNNDTSQIEVTVTAQSPTYLARVFHITAITVSAKAAARRTSAVAGIPQALFAGDTNCSHDGITLDKNNNTITGAAHSNGSLNVNGNNTSLGSGSYGGTPTVCSHPSAANFSGTLTYDPVAEAYPVTFGLPTPIVAGCCTQAQSAICTPGANVQNGANFTINSSSGGIYCATGTITVADGAKPSPVTLIAPKIVLPTSPDVADAPTLTPYYSSGGQSLLMYENGSYPIDFTTNKTDLTGVVFAPNAEVSFSKNNDVVHGFIEALNINIGMNSFSLFSGTGPTVGGIASSIAAVE